MLRIHTSDRLVDLADDLARLLGTVPPDPMTPEWIAAPSKAMQRWLSLRLAQQLGAGRPDGRADGVSANIEMSFPGSLMAHAIGADLCDDNPWEVERLAWSTLAVIDESGGDSRLNTLADPDFGSRFAKARRIADLFDRYDLHRPNMIRQWAAGIDVDGVGKPLAAHQLWQPHLWRSVRNHIGQPSPAERIPGIISRLESGQLRLDLPERLIMFGLSVVPGGPGFMDLAAAVGAHHDLHLFLVQPSPGAADSVRAAVSSGSITAGQDTVVHPLLQSWGKPAIDTARVLAEAHKSLRSNTSPRTTKPPAAPERLSAPTMLAALRADIRSNTAPSGTSSITVSDGSIRIHGCYGPTRQVEALRDSILGLLASDPTLNEDDIIVLTPALERFAPLVEAVFGPSAHFRSPTDPTSLRYRIADRSIRSSNPVLSATAQLLEMTTGRFEATTVLDFIALAPVRARFDLTTDDIATVTSWAQATNVRWGLDPEHRQHHGLPASIDTNTWQSLVDRLLIGSAITSDRPALSIGSVAPEGTEGSLTDVAGRLASVIHHLSRLVAATHTSRPIDEWIALMLRTCRGLFSAPPGQRWQFENLEVIVAAISDTAHATPDNSSRLLTFDDFRRIVGARMQGRPGRPDFFRGGITVSSLRPMRWLPHRVICVLGLDQSLFGRTSVDGDDLLSAAPLLGDFDPRGENRQALLEAVLSADDHLLIFRDGHDIRTNVAIPRATVVDELLDTLAAMTPTERHHELRSSIEVCHPRQPFDDRYFMALPVDTELPAGFDPDSFRGAIARRVREGGPPQVDVGDDAETSDNAAGGDNAETIDTDCVISLAEAHSFLKNPTRYFTSHVLQLKIPRRAEEISSVLPIKPGGLERWNLGEMMLDAAFGPGASYERPKSQPIGGLLDELVDHATMVERRTGSIPPAGLGEAYETQVRGVTKQVIEAAVSMGVRPQPPLSHAIDIALDHNTRMVGVVRVGLVEGSPGPVQMSFSTWKPGHLMAAWIDLMCLVAEHPETQWRGVTINPIESKEPKGSEVWELIPAGRSPGERLEIALDSLNVVAGIMRQAVENPVPLFPLVSRMLYLQARPESQLANPGSKGRNTGLAQSWYDSFQARGDRADPAVDLLYGAISIDELLDLEARANDPIGVGGHASRWAYHLWGTIDDSIQIHQPDGSQL